MATFQPVVQIRPDALPAVGSRYGAGHRPPRPYMNGAAVAQVDSVTFADNSDGTTWTVIVDGVSFTLLDTAVAGTAAAIANFMAQINGHPTVSQIVRPTAFSSTVMRLTARNAGTAFTATASAAGGGGTSTAVRAAVTANSAGQAVSAGAPLFAPLGGTNARLCRLPAAATDVFLGVAQLRLGSNSAELEAAHLGTTYAAGSLVPVDPNGEHVVICQTACNPHDPVFVTMTTGLYRASGVTGEVTRVTVGATPADSVTISMTLRLLDTGETYEVHMAADADSTATEVRDGLGDYINAHYATLFSAADQSTNAIDITGPVGRPFEIIESNIDLTVAEQTAAGALQIPGARWTTAATAGNKAVFTYFVP